MSKSSLTIREAFAFPARIFAGIASSPFRALKKVSTFLKEEPEDGPLSDALVNSIQHPTAFLENFEALRRHLFRILVALVIGVTLMLFLTPRIVDFLALPIGGLSKLTAIDVTESVGVFMRVAVFGSIAVASPYIAFELWLFAAPGLSARERKFGLLGIPLVGIFFIGGIAFSFYLMLPSALPFLLNFMGIRTLPRVSSYINFVTGLLFWIGIAFEFPLVIYLLSLMRIVKPKNLANQWRITIVLIAVVAAAITPTVDPVNMSLVMAPMIVLYFLSIGLSYLASMGRKKREQAELDAN
jgi:sec-independent protein translocase protein TatC